MADGTFAAVGTWGPKDGAVVGRHKIAVVSLDGNGETSDDVPAEYRIPDTSPVEPVEVQSGQNHFEFKVRKAS